MIKCMISWSSGKDSAWMVHVLRQQPDIELAGMLTTVNEVHQRVAMHAVRVELLQSVRLPTPGSISNSARTFVQAAE